MSKKSIFLKVLFSVGLILLLPSCDPPSDIIVSCDVQELISAINTANTDINL